jgi:RNA polymerase-binding transcription factor DksA
MDKDLLEKFKQKLLKEKEVMERSLQSFAKKDEKLKGDWDTLFPEFNSGSLEEAADEVEEYESRLPIEHTLELRLKDINLALEKIKQGNYGKCEKCGKEIPEERLKLLPEARTCTQCRSPKSKV